jgi:hypothetical protein
MQIITRHGGTSHYVRPDRVYRTSVLQPAIGYDPNADVQSVAASFTQYPMDLQTNGLGGLRGVGVIDRIRLQFAAWRAKKQAKKQVLQALPMERMHAIGAGGMIQPGWGAGYPQVGEEIAPQMIAKEQMVAHLLKGGGLPNAYARSQAETSWHQWTNRWWNG